MLANLLRRLRGALGTAVTWAAKWLLAGFPIHVGYWLLGVRFGGFWEGALGTMVTYGGGGFLAGAAFSVSLGIAGRGQRLAELKPGRVGLGSAAFVGLVLPGLMWYFGDPQISLLSGVIIASTIGGLAGLTALGPVKVAQATLGPGDEESEREPVPESPRLSSEAPRTQEPVGR